MKIVGYDWEAIQRAQQGGSLAARIDTSRPAKSAPTDADRELLRQHGSIETLNPNWRHYEDAECT